MTTASDLTAATARRPWYQSIAGNLLLAFALIAALTVSATLLSLIRFNQIDAVMNRLTGVSLPLVQSSLGVEAKTAELVVLATELSKAENEVQRFERMERLSDQIGQLWSVLSKLQTIISEETTAARLQQLVAAINTNIGDLDRSTREILLLGDRRHKAIDKIEAANEAALRLLLQVTDDILARIGARVDRARNGQTDAPDLQRDLASLRTAYAARADFNRVTTLLSGIGSAVIPDALPGLRQQLATAADSLSQSSGDPGVGCGTRFHARGRASRRRPIAGCAGHGRRRLAGDTDQAPAGTAGGRCAAGRAADDRARPARAGFEAQRKRRARSDQHRGALGPGDRLQPAVAHPDRGCEPHPCRSDRLAVRAALCRAAADRARDQHARDRARRAGDPDSDARPRRARRHEPDARGIPRQCPRHPRRQGRGREGPRRSRGRLAHEIGIPRQYEPRAAHAAQRHHRLQRDPGRGRDRSAATMRPSAICRRSRGPASICWG